MARRSISLLGCLLVAVAWADEPPPPVALAQSAVPLQWSLSDQELDSVLRRYRALHGAASGSFLEEVTVQSPLAPLKMRDLTQEIWTGPAAVFWALFHPTQSWRIFLPVPPKQAPPGSPEQGQ